MNIRNIDQFDIESIPQVDLDVWKDIKLDDLRIDGRLYPVGIKHSKERADKIGKTQLLMTLGAQFAPEHLSKFRALETLEEEMNLDEDNIVEFGVGLKEQADLAKISQLLQQGEQERNPDASASEITAAGGQPPAE